MRCSGEFRLRKYIIYLQREPKNLSNYGNETEHELREF